MSWATYNGVDSPLMEGDELCSPMIEHVAQAQKVQILAKVEPVHVSSGKLLRKKSPEEGLRSELDGREVEKKSLVQELKRKSPQQDMKERKTSPTKPELKRTSRISFREKKTSVGSMTTLKDTKSPKSEKMGGSPGGIREEVSPLFTPVQSGHRFSPLSPEDRKLSGQNFYSA